MGRKSITVKSISLASWLGRSYVRAALIPLLLIEIGFLAIYWISGNFTYDRNAEAVEQISTQYINDIAVREAASIRATLHSVEIMAQLLAGETGEALAEDSMPPLAERQRYAMSPDGVFYTTRGGPDESASFYSGYVPVGPEQIRKVWRTDPVDHVMRHIKKSSPLISQVYVNTHDSYNRIYPYFDVLEQYAPRMNIPSYNFYYEADAKHNPERKVVWTDSYVDPAGSGWMVSAIAPVYDKDKLEAVVGIDLTVDTLINRILDMKLPWEGYAILVGRNGTILALPQAAERDFALKELRSHHYNDAIRSDTFKPEQFNIRRRPELAPLAAAIARNDRQTSRFVLGGRPMLASNALIAGTNWQLVVIAPEEKILANASSLLDRLRDIGIAMFVILLLFYAVFFIYLARRARAMSRHLAEPLSDIVERMDRIGGGDYDHAPRTFGVRELDIISEHLSRMGSALGDARGRILQQQQEIHRALASEREITQGQRRFINIMSHEFRTPLTVIDSSAQILRRRAGRMTEEAMLERSDMIRKASARIEDVMKSAMQLVQLEDGEIIRQVRRVDTGALVREAIDAVRDVWPAIEIGLELEGSAETIEADPVLIRTALVAIIENACKFSEPGECVTVSLVAEDGHCAITVADEGIGIAEDEMPLVRERFYRGSNSTAVPGAGVGLFLASTLVEAHGGTLDIESTVGVGTRVMIRLPIAAPKALKLPEAA